MALVACSKPKAPTAVAARDLYTSDLYLKSRAWAERNTDSWFVLSALHGLLAPHTVTAPYDVTLNRMSCDERRGWAARVMKELLAQIGADTTVVFLAGANYREDLEDLLKGAGVAVEVPMRGLGIGQQRAWLKARLD